VDNFVANTVLLVGCGRMGGALLAGWLEQGLPGSAITIVEPQTGALSVVDASERGLAVVGSADALDPGMMPDVIVFAVKPQALDGVAPAYRRFGNRAVFLSVAAGRTIPSLQTLLGHRAAIVRCMPNTPAAIRLGVTVACANAGASGDQRASCTRLLEAVGEVMWIEDENLMDAVTAVSGSGPAYLFLLAEELAAAGIAAGLPHDLAERLARLTVTGAGALLATSPLSPSQLRETVTSPGGTTEAALKILMGPGGLGNLMTAAVRSAAERSRGLSRQTP
jgi:pyrroline-5-carboxylate reductase